MTHPAIIEARELLADEDVHLTALEHSRDHRLRQAVLLAPTLDICRALLAGERLPTDQLDSTWVRRFGIRP